MQQRRFSFWAYLLVFIDSLGYAFLFPLFPFLLLCPSCGILPAIESEGGRNLFLGLLLIAYPFGQLFGAPFFGNFADRYGRKQSLIWTLTGTLFGTLITAFGVKAKIYFLILFGRCVTGFFSATLIICMALLADLYEEKKRRASAFSLVSATLGIAWVVAIGIGTFFTKPDKFPHLDFSLPFWMVAALFALSLLIVIKFMTETFPHEKNRPLHLLKGVKSLVHLLEYKQFRVLCFTLFFWFFGFYIFLQWTAPMGIEKFHASERSLLVFFAFLGFFWALASGLANRWVIKFASLWKVTLWSLFLVSFLFFFASVADYFFYFACMVVLGGIFASITWGDLMSLISITTSPADQGKSLGTALSMLALGQLLGPLFGGIIAGFSIHLIFFVAAFLVFIAFLFLLIYTVQKMGKIFT